MSILAERLRRQHKAATAPVLSTAAIAGKTQTFNAGVGWHPLKVARETRLAGMLVQNVNQIGFGYGQGVAIKPDHSCELWGQNLGANLPWSVGPEGMWCGPWGYRTDLTKQGELAAEGFTKTQIEEKERTFALRIAGQLIFPQYGIVTWAGSTWEALVENCAVEPGTNPAVWVLATPQVPQFLKELGSGGTGYLPYAFDLGTPRAAPQLTGVLAVCCAGWHGIALMLDGSVRMWGHALRWGHFGTNMDRSYGPKPRPTKAPPIRRFPFRGTLTAGSAVVTALELIGELHHKVAPALSPYGPFQKDTLLLMPTPLTGLTGEAATSLLTLVGHGMESNTAVMLSALAGGSGLSTSSTYYVKRESADTFKLTATPGGSVVPFTTNVTAGTVTSLGIPTGAKIVSTTSHEVLDSEGHSYVPQRRILDTITLDQPATYSYVGKLAGKKPAVEERFWKVTEGTVDAAGWPVKPKLPPGVKIVAVASNGNGFYGFSLALTNTGEVLAWGSNAGGWMGNLGETGEASYQLLPAYVKAAGGANLKNIVAIATGEDVCLALDSSGRVWVWGELTKGQGGPGPLEAKLKKSSTPLLMSGLPTTLGERPVAIAACKSACYAILENGQLLSWGNNEHGELGNGTVSGKKSAGNPEPWVATPARVGTLTNIKYVAGGRQHAAAVSTAGALYTWGENDFGQLANGEAGKDGGAKSVGTVQTPDLEGRKVWSVTCSEYNTVVVLEGATAPPNRVKVTLVPQGELTGEPSAYVRFRWESAVTTGWRIAYLRQDNWWEEAQREALVARLEEELDNGELTGEAAEEAEEELEILAQEQEEREAGATKFDITPTEISPGVWEYEWISPGRLTPNSGYVVSIINPTHEPTPWNQAQVRTNGLWGSPYV